MCWRCAFYWRYACGNVASASGNISHITFSHGSNLTYWNCLKSKLLWCWGRNISWELSKCHACCCPDSFHHELNSIHCIDFVQKRSLPSTRENNAYILFVSSAQLSSYGGFFSQNAKHWIGPLARSKAMNAEWKVFSCLFAEMIYP